MARYIIGKTKSTFLRNEKYNFWNFRPFAKRLFDRLLIAAQTLFNRYKNPSNIFQSEGFFVGFDYAIRVSIPTHLSIIFARSRFHSAASIPLSYAG